MNTIEIIHKKRDGQSLSKEEIEYLIQGYTNGSIPDYQIAAWAMAICFQGMNPQETANLTMAMVQSGDQIDLSAIKGIKVDKHSTGGVGDTTTLILGPLVAAAGVPVAKMSGRGLGHTGGTIDKLESIEGFSTELTTEEFLALVNEKKLAVGGQTANLTPADKKLYALRDVTATVESIPLIASSVMSKKIATGADAIVLDVKTGDGAFMKEEEDAIKLAKAMVEIGQLVGRNTIAVISDMSQPLGHAVGNALEVIEAIDTLKGVGPADLTELTLVLGSQMLLLAGRCQTVEEARALLEQCIEDGSALEKLKEMIQGQHGNPAQIDHPELLPQAREQIAVLAEEDGFIQQIEAEEIGLCAMKLGAGRETKDDQIDHAVGVVVHKKVGDAVKKGEPIATLHVNRVEEVPEVTKRLLQAVKINNQPVTPPKLIRCIVTASGMTKL
ncbi:pyrimidine-nucleoside phosphorylase [Thermoflavimicrobium daqui]|uniref:Pyrimidine-nucleoside phosphorylase n=1 Tax=Thermoflavimicrobium daqui TaxID=2137476 RepID=A0A364K892_9BACL|nr:pyrimidine-nucleoside phosphorylase [Thermoflavimicrobium daqui]RAL26519.1 pyrimidine-nucleoside phosphorylase [Thermoflavimicrobium daqui]